MAFACASPVESASLPAERPAPTRHEGRPVANPAPQPQPAQEATLPAPRDNGIVGCTAAASDGCFAPLAEADKPTREVALWAIRDVLGVGGLVHALSAARKLDAGTDWYFQKTVFDLIEGYADPRGADALAGYLTAPHPLYFETRAALALAALGDLRAVPALAKRLRKSPLDVYHDDVAWERELRLSDDERVQSARRLADLAMMHTEALAVLRRQAEDALVAWLVELPAPHANGLRALAAMRSRKMLPRLRRWANPTVPLPHVGQPPPMQEEWIIAQAALRYAGMSRDEASWSVFERMLKLRPREVDVTMDALYTNRAAILGMSLRAVGVGAADGLSEWGDHRAYAPLLEYVKDPMNNEQSRFAACKALGWVAARSDVTELVAAAVSYASPSKEDETRRLCLLDALLQRPGNGSANAVMALFDPAAPAEELAQVARIVAKSGIDGALEQTLLRQVQNPNLAPFATLALMLGGTRETATRAVQAYTGGSRALARVWAGSFDSVFDEDLAHGVLFRAVDNATGLAGVVVRGERQTFARDLLGIRLRELRLDNGPHTLTRVRLRCSLYDLARGTDPERAGAAIRTLGLLDEQGVLAALAGLPPPRGDWARAAARGSRSPAP